MAEALTILVESAAAQRWFSQLIERGTDLSGLMRDIGEALLESTQQRFSTGTGPDGQPWAPLRDGSGRTPLVLTGTMRDQIFPDSGADWVEISATAKQARWHQEGTSPYVIRPKDKKALSWPGGPGPRGKVNHPGLPARPFIGLSAEDGAQIEALAAAWLELGAADGPVA